MSRKSSKAVKKPSRRQKKNIDVQQSSSRQTLTEKVEFQEVEPVVTKSTAKTQPSAPAAASECSKRTSSLDSAGPIQASTTKSVKRLPPFLVKLMPVILITLVCFSAYSNSFTGAFYLDDFDHILGNPTIQIKELTSRSLNEVITNVDGKTRVIPYISLAINYYFGKKNPWGYHLFNLTAHILTAVALYYLCIVMFSSPHQREKYQNLGEISLLATLLWAANPLNVNVVTYIIQRMAGMAALFFLLSLLLYIYARKAVKGHYKILFFSGSLIFAAVSFFCKQNAYFLPLVIIAFEVFFLQNFLWSKNIKKILIFSLALLLFSLIIAKFTYLGSYFETISIKYSIWDFSMAERLLTEPRVIFFYISLFFLPLPSRLNLLHDFPLSRGIFSPPHTILAIAGIFLLIWLIVFFYKRNKIISFALFWFIINLVIESTIIPLDIIFEHRMYLPSMLIFPGIISYMYLNYSDRRKFFRYCIISLIIISSFLTWQRNLVWNSPLNFWNDIVTKSPNLPRGHVSLATTLLSKGKTKEAKEHLAKALALEPSHKQAAYNLANLYKQDKNYAKALQILSTAISLKDKQPDLNRLRATIYMDMKNYQKAAADLEYVITLNSRTLADFINLGNSYHYLKNHRKSLEIYKQAVSLGSESATVYCSLGMSSMELNMLDQAVNYFKKAIAIDNNHSESHYNLGLTYSKMGLTELANKEMRLGLGLEKKSQVFDPHAFRK